MAKTRQLSFQHFADSSTLTSPARASSEYSHSHLSLLASTCFEFDTCLPTPTHCQRERANRSLLTVCRPAAGPLNTTNTLLQTVNIRPHTHRHMQAEEFMNELLLLTLALESLFPKAPVDRKQRCEIWVGRWGGCTDNDAMYTHTHISNHT